MYFYKEVIEQGGSPDAFNNVLAAGQDMKEFSGVSGTLHFDGKRGVTKAPMLYTVNGVEIVPVTAP